jgi:methylated-DNA-[protein]-cysteine S-methyltransferase
MELSELIHRALFDTPIGRLAISASTEAVLAIRLLPGDLEPVSGPAAAQVRCREGSREVEEFLAGERREFEMVYELRGTQFQRRVWQGMLQIPYGATATYGDLAKALGQPGANQAVGLACGANPLPLVVPCHRVVAGGGKMGGFSGGLSNKRWLLDLESGQGGLF